MREILKWVFLILVLVLVVGCDSGEVGDNEPVYCIGDKTDDPNCIYVDVVGDGVEESFDSESNSFDVEEECVPTIPEGAKVQCGDSLYPCKLEWDLDACRVSCWKLDGSDFLFKNAQPIALGSEYYNCTTIGE